MAVYDPMLICRLCAKESEFSVDIFGDEAVQHAVSKKIRYCLPITVRKGDGFPKLICLHCLTKLDISYELYSECLSAEHTIKRLMRYCSRPVETPVENNEIDTDCEAQREACTIPSESNPIVRYGDTLLTLVDKTSKRKSDDDAQEPKPKIRNTEYDECDDLNIKIDIDDSNPVGSPLQLPVLGNEDYVGGGDDDDHGGAGSDFDAANDDKYSHAPQQRSQLHLSAEDLSTNTVEPYSQTCLAGYMSTGSSLEFPTILPKIYIPDYLPITSINQQEVSTLGHARLPGNVNTTYSSQQIHIPITVPQSASVGQPVHSIPTNHKRTSLGNLYSSSNMGNQIVSNSSASSVVMTSSEQSSSVSEYETLSSFVGSALPVMVQQPGSHIARCPPGKSKADRLFSERRRLNGAPNTSITSLNPVLVSKQPEVSEATLTQVPAAEPGNILAEPLAVQATNQQIYKCNGVQDHDDRQEALILESQHSYFSVNPGQGQGVSSDTSTAITSPVVPHISPTRMVAVATVSTTASLGTVTAAHASFKPQAVSMSPGASPAYVPDKQGTAVTGFGINSQVLPSKICIVNSRPPSAVFVVKSLAASTETAAISNSNSTSSMHVTLSTTTNPVVTTSTSSPVSSVDVVETGTVQVTEGTQNECPHCHKKFPDNIIMHHVKLHYRRPFFSCISCDKNFRYEIGLEQHKCKGTAE